MEKNEIMKYEDINGREVALSVEVLRRVLPSLKQVKEDEVINFALRCKAMGLNPLLDVHNVKFGDTEVVTPIVKKDFYLQNASLQQDFRGYKAGIIVETKDGKIEQREGTFYLADKEDVVGGWAKVATELRGEYYSSVSYAEYVMTKRDGSANSMWTAKPATMLRKVALSQALREAYPIFAGTYDESELPDERMIEDTTAEDITPAQKKIAAVTEKAPAPKTEKAPAQAQTKEEFLDELFS